MKKITLFLLLTLAIIYLVSCNETYNPEANKSQYSVNSDPSTEDISLFLDVPFELSQDNIDNFLPTLEKIFNNFGSISGKTHSFVKIFFYEKKLTRESPNVGDDIPNLVSFSTYGKNENIEVVINKNFDDAIVDTKNENYYTSFVLLNGIDQRDLLNKKIEGKIYFRQLEKNKPSMAIMIMVKNDIGGYDYLADALTGNVTVSRYFTNEQIIPLPDYLK